MQEQLERTKRELKIRNYSGKTVKSYLFGLKEYFAFKKQGFESLDLENIKDFLLFVEKKGVSAQTSTASISKKARPCKPSNHAALASTCG